MSNTLKLDDYLIKSGIVDIRSIGQHLVVITKPLNPEKDVDGKRYEILLQETKTHDYRTPEAVANDLEKKCDKQLGRQLCQYIIKFICQPDNWETLNYNENESIKESELRQAEVRLKQEEEARYKPKHNFDTLEEWQSSVEHSYHHLHKVVDDNLAEAWAGIEFVLSIKAILHIKEITLPYIGILLGPPSGTKTIPYQLLRNRPYVFYTDDFNPHAIISHVASLPSGMIEGEQHMMNRMRNNLVLAPEMAPLLAKREDELRVIIAILTRVADGQGYESDSGLGHKGVTGKNMFVMGGAAVEIPPSVYKMLTTFGPKLYFFRLPKSTTTHDQYFGDLKGDQFTTRFQRMQEAMNEYLDIFESCPTGEPEDGSYLPKIPLDSFRAQDDEDALHIIVYLGQLLKHLRAVVWTYETTTPTKKTVHDKERTETIETEEKDFSFNTNIMEEQKRANRQNYNLAIGHALSQGSLSLRIEDIPIVTNVALSTAPQYRSKTFIALLENGGSITTKGICDSLGIYRTTAKKAMTELKAVGLVDEIRVQDGTIHYDQIVLKDEFGWFIGEEFKIAQKDDYKRYRDYLANLTAAPAPSEVEREKKNVP